MLGSRLGDDGYMRVFSGHFIPSFLLAILLVAGVSWAEEKTAPPAPTAEEQAIAEADRLLAGQNWQFGVAGASCSDWFICCSLAKGHSPDAPPLFAYRRLDPAC